MSCPDCYCGCDHDHPSDSPVPADTGRHYCVMCKWCSCRKHPQES